MVKLEDRRPGPLVAGTVTFSAYAGGADYGLEARWIVHRGTPVLDFSQTRLRGKHNAENVMAALAVGRAFGLPWEVMAEAVRGLSRAPPPLRVGRGCRWPRIHR